MLYYAAPPPLIKLCILKVFKALAPSINPTGIYLFKVNNEDARTMYEVCSKLILKLPERRHLRRSGICIVNFEQISHIVLVFPLLTQNKKNAGWEVF